VVGLLGPHQSEELTEAAQTRRDESKVGSFALLAHLDQDLKLLSTVKGYQWRQGCERERGHVRHDVVMPRAVRRET